MYWKVFTEAKTQDKAENVFRRILKALSFDYSSKKIEPYHKGGFVCSFTTFPTSKEWPEVVLESLSYAQSIGRSWIISGDIRYELDAWANESSVSGVQSIQLVVEKNA